MQLIARYPIYALPAAKSPNTRGRLGIFSRYKEFCILIGDQVITGWLVGHLTGLLQHNLDQRIFFPHISRQNNVVGGAFTSILKLNRGLSWNYYYPTTTTPNLVGGHWVAKPVSPPSQFVSLCQGNCPVCLCPALGIDRQLPTLTPGKLD